MADHARLRRFSPPDVGIPAHPPIRHIRLSAFPRFGISAVRHFPLLGISALMSKRIAVVAVHGVANQDPAASAEAIAAMLSGLDSEYSAFTATDIQLPLRPVRLGPPGPVLGEKASPGRLQGWPAYWKCAVLG